MFKWCIKEIENRPNYEKMCVQWSILNKTLRETFTREKLFGERGLNDRLNRLTLSLIQKSVGGISCSGWLGGAESPIVYLTQSPFSSEHLVTPIILCIMNMYSRRDQNHHATLLLIGFIHIKDISYQYVDTRYQGFP